MGVWAGATGNAGRPSVDGTLPIGLKPARRNGGHSSVGRAPGCGPGCHGFESRCSPHPRGASAVSPDNVAGLILAGGKARRMGGGDKPLLRSGRTPPSWRGSSRHAWRSATLRHQRKRRSRALCRFRPAGARRRRVRRRGTAGRGACRAGLGNANWGPSAADGSRRHAVHSVGTGRRPGAGASLRGEQWPAALSGGTVACRLPRRRCANCCSAWHRRDVAYFARQIGMRQVDFPVTKWDPFLNINTPEELALARAIAEGEEMMQDGGDRWPRSHRPEAGASAGSRRGRARLSCGCGA